MMSLRNVNFNSLLCNILIVILDMVEAAESVKFLKYIAKSVKSFLLNYYNLIALTMEKQFQRKKSTFKYDKIVIVSKTECK